MPISLTPQQQQALDSSGDTPTRLVDPRDNAAYILLPESEYERIRELLEEDRKRAAIHEAALRNAVGRMDDLP